MKALSIKQPYAELIVQGKKKIELRKWNTYFRGEFYIHASKNPDEDAMKKFGFVKNSLPCGAIVGSVELIDIKEYKNEEEHKKDAEKHLASSIWGNYGFILEKAKRIKLIPAKGQLGFWEYDEKSL